MKKIYCLLGLILLFGACQKKEPPVVMTGEPTVIEAETAKLVGTLVDDFNADITEVGIMLGTTKEDVTTSFPGELVGLTISAEAKNLVPGTEYFYCAYATSEHGVGKGDVKSFQAGCEAPVVSIIEAVATGVSTVKVTGRIDDNRGSEITSFGFTFAEGNNYDVLTYVFGPEFDAETNTFTAVIGGLVSNTEYSFVAGASNTVGGSTSDVLNVTTMTFAEYYTSTIVNVNGLNISSIEVPMGLYLEIKEGTKSDLLLPASGKTYATIANFIRDLNNATGKTFRLPTVDEWYAAANDGKAYSGSDDVNAVAWYLDNSGSNAQLPAQKQANAYGLYDMSGNVWEMTSTAVDNNSHYICGGCYTSYAEDCKVDSKLSYSDGSSSPQIGFRLVLE